MNSFHICRDKTVSLPQAICWAKDNYWNWENTWSFYAPKTHLEIATNLTEGTLLSFFLFFFPKTSKLKKGKQFWCLSKKMPRLIHRYKWILHLNTKFHRRKLMRSLILFQKVNVNTLTPSLKKSNVNTMNQIWYGYHRGLRREEGHRNYEKINKFDIETCLILPKRAVGSKGLFPGSILYSQAERSNANYLYTSLEPQPS